MNAPAFAPFRRFWITRVCTIMAFQMQAVALGWQVYALHHRAMDLAWVGLISFMPAVLLMLIIGQAADHFERRKLAMTCQVVSCLLALGLAWHSRSAPPGRDLLFAFIFLLGSAKAFESPALAAMLPELVDAEHLPRAISASSAAMQVAVIAGPALGGLLYAVAPAAVYIGAASLYLGAITAIAPLRRPRQRVSAPPRWHTMLAGIRYIWERRILLGTLSLDLFAVLLGGATALLPMVAHDILRAGPLGLGLLRSAPAAGALIVSLWLSRHTLRHAGRWMFVAVGGFGVCTIVFGLSHSMPLSLLALATAGASDMISVVIRSAMVQLETPNDMRGRVSAVNFLFIGTSNQLGEFESGVTAACLGAEKAIVLGGLGSLLIAALWYRYFPEMHRYSGTTTQA